MRNQFAFKHSSRARRGPDQSSAARAAAQCRRRSRGTIDRRVAASDGTSHITDQPYNFRSPVGLTPIGARAIRGSRSQKILRGHREFLQRNRPNVAHNWTDTPCMENSGEIGNRNCAGIARPHRRSGNPDPAERGPSNGTRSIRSKSKCQDSAEGLANGARLPGAAG